MTDVADNADDPSWPSSFQDTTMRRPSGFSFGPHRFAIAWLMMTVRVFSRESRSSNNRPATCGIPIAAK